MDTVSTEKAPAAIGPYVQGRMAGGFLFASGQIPLDPSTGEIVGSDITEQTARVMSNVRAVLEAAGVGMDAIVKTTCFLADINDFAAFNAIYAEYFKGEVPARSCFQVAALPMGAKLEIECIAVK